MIAAGSGSYYRVTVLIWLKNLRNNLANAHRKIKLIFQNS
jgi:hypothetical protein